MREGVLINQKEDDIERKLMNFSMGGRDASDFTKWQQEMRQVCYFYSLIYFPLYRLIFFHVTSTYLFIDLFIYSFIYLLFYLFKHLFTLFYSIYFILFNSI